MGSSSSGSSSDNTSNNTDNTDAVYLANDESINIPSGTPQALKLVEVAKSQIGVRETPNGSDNVKYNDWYLKGHRAPWCCAFVSWCAEKAGIPKSIIPKDNSCSSMVRRLKQLKAKEVNREDAAPGDIMFIKGGSAGYQHTGIVYTNKNGKIKCIEGNLKSGMVQYVDRNHSGIIFIRPAYKKNVVPTTQSSDASYGQAADVVRIAQRELNLTDGSNKENPMGSNRVKYNDWFKNGSNTAWCGAFASWVANQAGVPTSVVPKSRSASGIYNDIGKNGGSYPSLKSAMPGDFYVRHNNGKISHIGIVESHNGSNITTIDGNWSDKVSRVKYKDTDTNTIKIARPAYGSGVGTKPVAKYGQFKENIYGKGKNYSNAYKPIARSGQGTTIKVDPSVFANTDTTENITYSKTPKYALGTNTQTVVAKPSITPEVIKSILELLFKIANNTDMLNLILKLLKEKLDIKINANDIAEAQRGNSTSEKLAAAIANSNSSALSKLNTYANTIENDSISSLIAGLNAIAAE